MVTEQFTDQDEDEDEEEIVEPERFASAIDVIGRIEAKRHSMQQLWTRMDDDYDRYTLTRWEPDPEESISDDDIYTTNEPRVLAEKIISFITATVPVIAADNSNAQEEQEEINDLAEQLAIGMLNNADGHLRRQGFPSVQDQLGFFTVVRGRYAAARAVLRKRPNGDTFEDILPLDPRFLIIQQGDGELLWAAYRMRRTVEDVIDEFPDFEFRDRNFDPDETVDVWEYFSREPNDQFFPQGDLFQRHPFKYMAGTIIDDKWAKPLRNLFALKFPIVLAPITAQPELTPVDRTNAPDVFFGESVFAENREVWDMLNRAGSQVSNLMSKAVDPRKKVKSLDGTKSLDDGTSDAGAEINLSTANDEDVENYVEADVNNAASILLSRLQQDSVAGGLPPQAFGLLDKPLSSVALRQLGNNLEHRVLPRMRAVARCLEGCLENLIAQYETGAFEPITASGRRYDNARFANRVIEPEEIVGHDPVEIRMDLALPEDEATRWSLAQMALAPTASGESIASLEWVREKILKLQSHKQMSRQNLEGVARSASPVAQAMSLFNAALRDGDMALASIWFDKLQVVYLQEQVQGKFLEQQLLAAAQGLPIQPLGSLLQQSPELARTEVGGNNQSANPANGAVPFAQQAGVGNEPSQNAGAFTAAPRQPRDTGLVDPAGRPLTVGP